jgi:threonine dehydrogenase-like Zn-dependent dehydrogenase
MKALVYTAPETLAYRDAPDPAPGAEEAALTVEAVGICGSDMHAFLGHDERRPAPLILGHEAAGRLADGTRVVVNPLVTCGEPAPTAGRAATTSAPRARSSPCRRARAPSPSGWRCRRRT